MSTTETTRTVSGTGTSQPATAAATPKITYGRNGVPITPGGVKGHGFRTYEVHQRERLGESTAKIKAGQLISPEFVRNPYPFLEILRENYPAYRDWLENSYWITQYNDVTSIFTDDANFETRPKRWFYGIESYGRDLRQELPVLFAQAKGIDDNAAAVAEEIIADFSGNGRANLAIDFAGRYALELLARVLDLPKADIGLFSQRYWRMQRGFNWEPNAEQDGLAAIRELTEYFRPLLAARRANPGSDLISAVAMLDADGGETTAEDLVITLLEQDHETLHGALSNMLFLLLTHPEQLDRVMAERRLVKFAYLETLRHSTPVLSARRFARHEVERFGKLIPEGGMMICSAAAANRDPRQYKDPDVFVVGRKDLCQREPRGQYRADGLPAGIAFGLGAPTKHPAVPEDRPRSLYAITRDTATTAASILLDSLPNLRLQAGAKPELRSLRLWEMHTCWNLPVEFDAR
ncbi:cytochrome P450 [Iodidimonas sp. SYSU 1G8]|uniref:cytochrome P450 n=1 Tax=Iodidimonas sp. SYSU 1G8 TaxID=3133967 RepID=UPI0031FE5CE7